MRFSALSFAAAAIATASLATATRTSIRSIATRADQTIVSPLSDDPIGPSIEFQFADESHTAGSTSFVRTTLRNSTFSTLIGDNIPFESARPDFISTSLPVPAEFVKGFYDLVVEEVDGDGSVIFTGESTDLAYLIF
ncbi:hypothetical protein DICSQDRAFT_182023 [Dichomitus squalens LYAD-421 SS1]|uniref:Uncharacterized protein n=1 Tax=Dichomitus squalens (strain LYAD-421) TaxID=732165 RepID=R7SUC6_DICSQ|nr:uncharacterized protein DICSQDRAFT_182023 [Dichomitus squalens LYAD-421 SS1]EJF59355.1 hypothetical protein DICSQDRAFT_182023 [Dichomitus squalens LYAD-421 SS1]